MAAMKWKDAQELIRLGFKQVEDRDHWTRHFNEDGKVKTVLLVRETVVGYEYRVTVANTSQRKGTEQWFHARDIGEALVALLEAMYLWTKARRALEGGLARRLLRRICW